ncbi:MAG: hypothetical protein ACUVX9_04390 [Anaerolineae bacterium]
MILATRAAVILGLEIMLAAVLLAAVYAIKRLRARGHRYHCLALTLAFAGKTLLFFWGMSGPFKALLPALVALGWLRSLALLLHAAMGTVSLLAGWFVILWLQLKIPWPQPYSPFKLRTAMRLAAWTWLAGLAAGVALYWMFYQ